MKYDASNSEVLLYTFKEGVLSRMAHDLELRVTEFAIVASEDGQTINGQFDPRSIRVVKALAGGTLSSRDIATIEKNIVDDVLEVRRHREIRFNCTARTATHITGKLYLHGVERTVGFEFRESATHYEAEVRIHQPDYGIKPYSAMLGALKIKPEILVKIRLPKAVP